MRSATQSLLARATAVLLALALTGSCATGGRERAADGGATEPPKFVATWDRIDVTPAQLAGARLGPFQFVGLHRLQTARQGGSVPDTLGGISSILASGLTPDGAPFITDQGHLGVLPLPASHDQPLFGAISPIYGPDGRALVTWSERDSEGLTEVMRQGVPTYAISFEREHRILFFPNPGGGWSGLLARSQPGPPLMGTEPLQSNGGIEAVEALPDGRLLAIAEYAAARGADQNDRAVPFWLLDPDQTAPVPVAGHVAISDGYGVTEARLLGTTLWLILRRWTREEGTRVRLASCPLAGFQAGAPACTVQAQLEPPFPVENFEALTISPAASGSGWTFRILADDNFEPGQQTLLLHLFLPDLSSLALPR